MSEVNRRQGDSGMTNEQLYKMAIEPRLKAILNEISELKEANTAEHGSLTEAVDKVHGRVFVSNGQKALTVEVAENRDAIEELKKVSHAPRMGRQKLAVDGLKVGGGASGLVIIHAVWQFVTAHWTQWFPPSGAGQ